MKINSEVQLKRDQHDAKMIKASKPREELMVEVSGLVSEVIADNILVSVPGGGGFGSYHYDAGYTGKVEISIDAPHTNLKQIVFEGFSVIRPGDFVTAGIFAGAKMELWSPSEDPRVLKEGLGGRAGYKYYAFVPTDLGEVENALYLKIHEKNGNGYRTEKSIRYSE